MNTSFKIIRIGGKCYPLFAYPLIKLRRIAALAKGLNGQEPGDVPGETRLVARIVAAAIAGNGPSGRLEAYRLYRKLTREARPGELAKALITVMEMVPIRAYYTANMVTTEFNKLISK